MQLSKLVESNSASPRAMWRAFPNWLAIQAPRSRLAKCWLYSETAANRGRCSPAAGSGMRASMRRSRGQDGSLLLSCGALSSPTARRFIPTIALAHAHGSVTAVELFAPQRLDRIDLGRAVPGRPAGKQSHQREQQPDSDKRRGIAWRHLKQKRSQHTRQNKRRENTRKHAARDQPEAFRENQPPDMPLSRTHGAANRKLAPARCDRQRKHPVNPYQRQNAADDRKPNQQPHRKGARSDGILANLFERSRVLSRRRGVDRTQRAQHR